MNGEDGAMVMIWPDSVLIRPGQPLQGLDRGRDLKVGRLAARGQLDQGVGVALGQQPVIVGA